MAKVLRRELLKELKKVVPVLPKNTSLDIIEGILVEVKNNRFQMSATNLESSIITSFEYDGGLIPEEFSFIIEGKMFHDIISKMGDSEVDITFSDETITIKGKGSNFNLTSKGKANEFPNIVEVDEEDEETPKYKTVTINSDLFKEIVVKTIGFTSDDDTRPTLGSVKFEIRNNKIVGVALDGFRLSYMSGNVDTDDEVELLVPAKSLVSVIKAMDDETIAIKYIDNIKQIGFVIGDTTLYTKQLTGQFYNYKDTINLEDCTATATVSLKELTEAIERVCIMAKDKDKFAPISFRIQEKYITIKANSEIGDVVEKVVVDELEGEGLDIAFNPIYILEGLKVCKSENIKIKFISPLRQAYIIEDDTNYLYMVLPVRLNKVEEEAA